MIVIFTTKALATPFTSTPKRTKKPQFLDTEKSTIRSEPGFDELNVTAVENDTSVVKLAMLRGFRVDVHVGLGDTVSTRWDEEIERYRKRSRVKKE